MIYSGMTQIEKRLLCILSNYVYFTIGEVIPIFNHEEPYINDIICSLQRDFITQSYALFFDDSKNIIYKTTLYKDEVEYKKLQNYLKFTRDNDTAHINRYNLQTKHINKKNNNPKAVQNGKSIEIVNGKHTGWVVCKKDNNFEKQESMLESIILMMLKIYDEYFDETYKVDDNGFIVKKIQHVGTEISIFLTVNLLSKMDNGEFYIKQYIIDRVGKMYKSDLFNTISITNCSAFKRIEEVIAGVHSSNLSKFLASYSQI